MRPYSDYASRQLDHGATHTLALVLMLPEAAAEAAGGSWRSTISSSKQADMALTGSESSPDVKNRVLFFFIALIPHAHETITAGVLEEQEHTETVAACADWAVR